MEVRCPACSQLLNVAQAAPGAALQCPFCHGMFQLAAPPMAQPAAAGAYAGSPVPPASGYAPAGGYAPAPQPAFAEPETFVASRRVAARRRKNDTGVQLAVGVLLAAVVVGLIGAGIWYAKQQTQETELAAPAPIDPISQRAHELVSQEMKLPQGAQFMPERNRVQKLPQDRYRVTGYLNVPSRMAGTFVQQKWDAHIAKLPDDKWTLERLEVDNQLVTTGGDASKSERPSQFGANWLTNGENNNTGGKPAASNVDRSTRWAVNAVAEDIRESARLRKTLVVWLIDRSMSARPQLQDFVQNVDELLKDLRGDTAGEVPPLSMAVVAFGSEVQFVLDKPSSNADDVRQALQSIETEDSGREVTFTAITQAAEKFGSFRVENGGYVVFVVVSDEMGDDDAQLDQTAALLKQQQMVVHTIGVSAPFGLPVADAQRSLEGGGDTKGPSRVRQGPESRYSEMISLASIGGVAVELDSGFGPFSLSRLCHESGGRYLACKDYGVAAGSSFLASWGGGGSSSPVFEPAVLSKYAPDYVTEQAYQQILASNKACMALHEASKLPYAETLRTANTMFPKRDEASFKRSLDAAQRDAAKFEPKLIALHETLKKGESDRPKLTRLRWQAAYDLAMGRALAARVKTEGYNQMLAKIKAAGNFTVAGANTWVLNESDTIGAGSTFEKMLTQSREYLERVVKNHPGTPWAYLAERELEIKAGWQWSEQ